MNYDISGSQTHNTAPYRISFPWPFQSDGLARPTWKSRCSMHTVHHRERENMVIHVLLKLSKQQVSDVLWLAASSLTSDWLIFSLSVIHFWQGHPVSSLQFCDIDRDPVSSIRFCTSYWKGDPVNSMRLCTIDSVTLSIASALYECHAPLGKPHGISHPC